MQTSQLCICLSIECISEHVNKWCQKLSPTVQHQVMWRESSIGVIIQLLDKQNTPFKDSHLIMWSHNQVKFTFWAWEVSCHHCQSWTYHTSPSGKSFAAPHYSGAAPATGRGQTCSQKMMTTGTTILLVYVCINAYIYVYMLGVCPYACTLIHLCTSVFDFYLL